MMIDRNDLEGIFSRVNRIEDAVFRCEDALLDHTVHTYIWLGDSFQRLVVSAGLVDDRFAVGLLKSTGQSQESMGLAVRAIKENEYGFSSVLTAPSDFHNQLRGRLDGKRQAATLCIPIHRCEFASTESRREFQLMCNKLVPVWDWRRPVCPKVILRSDNPKTGGGTGGADVLVRWQVLRQEIEALNGVAGAFVEIQNYLGRVLELLSDTYGTYWVIRDRQDAERQLVPGESIESLAWEFLTQGPVGA